MLTSVRSGISVATVPVLMLLEVLSAVVALDLLQVLEEHVKVTLTLTLMLLVANLANTKRCKKSEIYLKTCQMGTHLRVLSESYPMNTNMKGFRWVSKFFASLCFGRK